MFDTRESIPDDMEIGLEITNVWRRIYSEWFPSSQFEQVEGPCIEKNYWIDEIHSEVICEVWIPVSQKRIVFVEAGVERPFSFVLILSLAYID